MEEKKTQNTTETVQPPDESCPRNYKPWIWTLILMAALSLGWAVYEGYQEGGVIKSLIEGEHFGMLKGEKFQGFSTTGGVPTPAGNLQNSYHELIEKVRPSVISIDVAVAQPQVRNPQAGMTYTRVGSGVIITPRGYALSNLHVIVGAIALKATVYGAGGARDYPVKVVNVDRKTDLVLLRIQGAGPFPYAVLGDSDAARTGDVVLAMGSPFGFDQTITAGIISSRNRVLHMGGNVYEGLIQTDTPINKGNSGGPLVNAQGEIIGLNTAIYSPSRAFSGIGFAIPINKAATLVEGVVNFRNSPSQVAEGQLVAWSRQGKQMGNSYKLPGGQIVTPPHGVRGRCIECHPQLCNPGGPLYGQMSPRSLQTVAGQQTVPDVEPFLGATVLEVDPVIAKHFGLISPGGVLVDRVYQGTPAETAGLSRGDVIIRIDGRKVRGLNDFNQTIAAKKIGSRFELQLLSDGTRETVKIRTAAMPAFMPRPQVKQVVEFEWLGSEISPLSPALAAYVKEGVFVSDAGGILAASGVMRRDIIAGVNNKPVTDMSSFIKLTQEVNPAKGLLLDVIRSGKSMYITVK